MPANPQQAKTAGSRHRKEINTSLLDVVYIGTEGAEAVDFTEPYPQILDQNLKNRIKVEESLALHEQLSGQRDQSNNSHNAAEDSITWTVVGLDKYERPQGPLSFERKKPGQQA